MSLRIVLVDDHAGMRRCLAAVLEREPGMQVIMQAANGREALAAFEHGGSALPDLLLLDMDLPDLDGLQVARQLLSRWPSLCILVLSWHDDLPLMLAATNVGCRGYMLKDDAPNDLIRAVHEVTAGHRYFSPGIRCARRSTS